MHKMFTGDMERSLPDLPNRVFVYGSLKSGLANHDHLIKGEHGMSRYLGPARTREAYPLVVFTKCNVPFLLYAEGKGQVTITGPNFLLSLNN